MTTAKKPAAKKPAAKKPTATKPIKADVFQVGDSVSVGGHEYVVDSVRGDDVLVKRLSGGIRQWVKAADCEVF